MGFFFPMGQLHLGPVQSSLGPEKPRNSHVNLIFGENLCPIPSHYANTLPFPIYQLRDVMFKQEFFKGTRHFLSLPRDSLKVILLLRLLCGLPSHLKGVLLHNSLLSPEAASTLFLPQGHNDARNLSEENTAGSIYYYHYPLYTRFILFNPCNSPQRYLFSPFSEEETEVQSGYIPYPSDWTRIDSKSCTVASCQSPPKDLQEADTAELFSTDKDLLFCCVSPALQSDLSFRFSPPLPSSVRCRRGKLYSLLRYLVKKSLNTELTHHHGNYNLFLWESKWDAHLFITTPFGKS